MNCATEWLKDIAYDYWCRVQACIKFRYEAGIDMALYGLNQYRIELHDELCAKTGLRRTDMADITDNMDRYANFNEFWEALKDKIKAKDK